MKKILAFAGSNSPTSINHQLVLYAAERLHQHQVEVLELKKLHIPIFSIALEKEGFPEDILWLHSKIKETDALVISVNEYNSNVSGFFKNVIDWLSRVEKRFLEGKPILLMSTAPGKRGGASALEYVKNQFPRFGAEIRDSFSLPYFYDNFDSELNKINNDVFELGVLDVITNFSQEITEVVEE